ncbi:unnamed protein product [Adineta steineri]|uniref:Uncharacterized protein n=1 Tax=Adineta steineri TaxID=433720 RepID=A0A815ZLL8_9BILA|nr:unnamed protein product [Adineta steineri]CAF1586322.1 unnamed protein product [Adineta steineri]
MAFSILGFGWPKYLLVDPASVGTKRIRFIKTNYDWFLAVIPFEFAAVLLYLSLSGLAPISYAGQIYHICLAILGIIIVVTASSSSLPSSLSTSTSIATSSNTPSTTTLPSSSSSTAASTTTTTAVYCASTCTGSFNSSANTTTCSLYCDDGGSYYCRSTSTYCAGQYYDPAGFGFCNPASSRFTGSCNTTDYCCVYDNYYPDYYCLSKISCGFSD